MIQFPERLDKKSASMGALTCNRERAADFFTSNYKTPPSVSSIVDHISKKPRLSTSMYQIQEHPFPRKSIATRVSKYPSYITPIKREIHAPCRPSRFGNMGNFLAKKYDTAKRSALESLRFVKKDKEVINIVVDDEEIVEKGVFGDSTVEELGNGVVEKTGLDNGLGQIWEGSNGVVAKMGLDNGSGQRGKESNGVVEILDNSLVVTVSNDVNLKNEEKMLDSLSLSSKFDDSSVPMYKKLLGRVKHQLLRPQKKEEHVKEDVISEPFVPLAEGEEAEVSRALSNANRTKVLVTHENSNVDITGEILQCLRPGAWLNDEVINVYLELLKEREKREPKKFLKCHFFNTFFYKKLISGKGGYNYQPVKRWTSQRKLGYCLFECDKIFVPIHKQVHWCLAVINKKDEKFQYLDSLGGRDNQVLRVLARYFIDEVKDKNGKDIDVSSWKLEFVEDLPEQQNGVNYLDISSDLTTVGGPAFSGLRNNEDLPPEWFDCGMFMLKYADFYSRDIGLCFNQEHMPYFRSRTAKEILRLKAE